MKILGSARGFGAVLATILICPISLKAVPIISVTGPPSLSTLIHSASILSTSWSQSQAYTGVAIAVLVNSPTFGQSPLADAYLTTRIGPGTTVTDEIAHTQFAVPLQLPVCSQMSCGAYVTLFSGLSLGPGDYFLTLGPDAARTFLAGWFPVTSPTVLLDTGVTQGATFFSPAMAPYAPASAFGGNNFPMNFIVTGTAVGAIPEPATAPLIGVGALLLVLKKRIAQL